jgi:ADP-L-glycero-D-manno-heptose 6-epimerase
MYLVTGGAGFIGSNIARALASLGQRVIIVDWLGSDDKWRNIADILLTDIVQPEALPDWLVRHAGHLRAVVHMGAISATTETDGDLILRNNVQASLRLWHWCATHDVPFLYASSAATYGDGAIGFDDRSDAEHLARLRPLNLYGWSKHVVDRRLADARHRGEKMPTKWAGLKFFNVYGPGEAHKGPMRSLPAAQFEALRNGATLRLFRSDRAGVEDGGQTRDFIHVDDCVRVVLWMLSHDFEPGLYNVGSGLARTWLDLGRAMFAALHLPPRIEFIDMPEVLKGRYQSHTEARIERLRAAGFMSDMTDLETGIRRYMDALRGSSSDLSAMGMRLHA